VVFPNPAYTHIAPCPCDLTFNFCDINCCCDQDCTSAFIEIFDCLTGPFGGDYVNEDENFCYSTESTSGWHQFACVEISNNPYLGDYFINSTNSLKVLQTQVEFESRVSSVNKLTYSYQTSDLSFYYDNPFKSILPTGYQQGDILYFKEPNSTLNSFLTFPQVTR